MRGAACILEFNCRKIQVRKNIAYFYSCGFMVNFFLFLPNKYVCLFPHSRKNLKLNVQRNESTFKKHVK